MEQDTKSERFAEISARLKQDDFSLRPSKNDNLWVVERDGRSICRLNGEKLVYDDNVNFSSTTQAHFSRIFEVFCNA
ncbi:MAG: hypothetical protein SO072_03410 [Dysosmobacter sp.]|nr:hypothetical protein [Dysosmobacter sp.]